MISACNETKVPEKINVPVKTDNSPPSINYTLIGTTPHDTNSFTEGLLFYNSQLFESTGAPDYLDNARSLFGIVDLKTGKIDKKAELDKIERDKQSNLEEQRQELMAIEKMRERA